MSTPRRPILFLVAAALFAGAGCGGDDGDGVADGEPAATQAPATQGDAPAETAAPDGQAPADPEAAFRRFQAALADGDAGTACSLLADAGRRQVEEASIGGSCEDWVEEFSGVFTDEIRQGLRDIEAVEVTEEGDAATVRYRSPILDLPLEARLERSGDGWAIAQLGEGV